MLASFLSHPDIILIFAHHCLLPMPFRNYSWAHVVFMIVGFACFGITVEVFFTAFTALFTQTPLCGKPLAAMAGTSYVWMAFIYGLIPIFGILLHDKAKPIRIWLRLPMYVLIIYGIEFTSGYLLQYFTGDCPWHYTSGWNVMGLIRLDYFPAWLFFAGTVEQIYIFMNTRVIR
jgi:hypothetical protein